VNVKLLLEYTMFAEILIALVALGFMANKRLVRDFYALAALLIVISSEEAVSICIMYFRKSFGIEKQFAYKIYFFTHWVCFFAEYALLLLVIYSIFRLAMRPLEGLHRAGKIIFRWVCGVSLAVSLGFAIGPNAGGLHYIAGVAGRVQQGISVLILCLLLFVCFSTRYLGLTYRSHIFGVSLGLGVLAATSLVESAWYSTSGAQSLYSPIYIFGTLGGCVALLVWGAYFAMPEPKRQMVLLPTTSPFFFWNRVSEALGSNPGYVAVAGFKPEMLTPAELQVMTAASIFARERERKTEVVREQASSESRPAAMLHSAAIRS